jgi:Fur family ferric uptake transcriptional regulator
MSQVSVQSPCLPCGRPKLSKASTPSVSAQGRVGSAESESPGVSAKRLEVWQSQLKAYLVSQGLKYTKQRWKIAELILSAEGHLDAQALVEQVKKKHRGIGSATVYRSIKVLCDALILRESLTDAQGRVVYERFDEEHHDHIVCLDCSEIFEFHDQKIESQQSALLGEMGFQEVRHRHVVYAHCSFSKR